MSKKGPFSVAFKREVIDYVETEWCTVDTACSYFSARNHFQYNRGVFYQWYRSKERIKATGKSRKRTSGGGRKPQLKGLEKLLSDEIVELRLMKLKVSRSFIVDRARMLAQEHGIELQASNMWLQSFLKRNNFTLQRTTNFTTLTDPQVVQLAIDYMICLRNALRDVDRSKTLLMDETAVFFEDTRTQTIDIRGRRHIVMKATGFSSMRITVVAAVWADGTRRLR